MGGRARRGIVRGGLALACLATALALQLLARPVPRESFAVTFSPRGDRIAALTSEARRSTLRIWDAAGNPLLARPLPGLAVSLAYSSDGTRLAMGFWEGQVQLRDAASGDLLRSFEDLSLPVRGLAFLPDGNTLAAGASDGRVRLWDVATGRIKQTFSRTNRLPVNALAVSPDGRTLAVAGGTGTGAVEAWDLGTEQPLPLTSLNGAREPIAFATDRQSLAASVGGPSGSIRLANPADDRLLAKIPATSPRSLAFSPDNRLLAIGGDDERVRVLDRATGTSVAAYEGHVHTPGPLGDDIPQLLSHLSLAEPRTQNTVWSVAFSPNSARLASASHDGTIWLWRMPNRAPAIYRWTFSGPVPLNPPGHLLLPRAQRPLWILLAQVVLGLTGLASITSAILPPRRTLANGPEPSRT